jgi:hypothetical protein
MDKNYYEEELRKELGDAIGPQRLAEVSDSAPYFERVAGIYPFVGSKIDWESLPNYVEEEERDIDLRMSKNIEFFSRVISQNDITEDIIYICDGNINFALVGSLAEFSRVLSKILEFPQHHYFISAKYEWCMCFSMEGYMSFGFRPSASAFH